MCKKFPKKRFLVSNENLKYLCPETEKDSDPWNMVPDIENIDDRSRGLRLYDNISFRCFKAALSFYQQNV